LKKNGKFNLVNKRMDYDCHYSGNYEIKNDTLKLNGNLKNNDTLYFIDRNTNMLISINNFREDFKIDKISP